MIGMFARVRAYVSETWRAWDQFWFAPADPATLSLIRVLAGALLLYTHVVWSLDLEAFLGELGWHPVEFVRDVNRSRWSGDVQWSVWSLFFWIKAPWLLWCVHIFALVTFLMVTIGCFSRVACVVGFFLAVSYAHRVSPGAFFGLDKLNCTCEIERVQ